MAARMPMRYMTKSSSSALDKYTTISHKPGSHTPQVSGKIGQGGKKCNKVSPLRCQFPKQAEQKTIEGDSKDGPALPTTAPVAPQRLPGRLLSPS
ncbi:hypothetical protein E2C01_006260 [Portunus trituberculatus]|uniref:Uncharacterized protein n=1 Tax=Portunus trituberculatus TaxID=210409 RepID=A0A5B7CXP0_PORTR|nr:hypothetical protein [Portunus trituberculatus]